MLFLPCATSNSIGYRARAPDVSIETGLLPPQTLNRLTLHEGRSLAAAQSVGGSIFHPRHRRTYWWQARAAVAAIKGKDERDVGKKRRAQKIVADIKS